MPGRPAISVAPRVGGVLAVLLACKTGPELASISKTIHANSIGIADAKHRTQLAMSASSP